MKKNVLAFVAALFLMSACGPSIRVNMEAVPQGKPAYGFTEQGVFFIHEALLGFPEEGAEVVFASEITGWKSRKTDKHGDYYLYNIIHSSADIRSFSSYENMRLHYFFVLGKIHVPHHLVKKHKDLFPEKDLGGYSAVGTTFFTHPLEKGPWQ
ncbi:MAG: hypothetical protein KKA60_07660 [Proteobacteria bacterium]|nr:hypothetical protein [Pseudomonadota bacterium]